MTGCFIKYPLIFFTMIEELWNVVRLFGPTAKVPAMLAFGILVGLPTFYTHRLIGREPLSRKFKIKLLYLLNLALVLILFSELSVCLDFFTVFGEQMAEIIRRVYVFLITITIASLVLIQMELFKVIIKLSSISAVKFIQFTQIAYTLIVIPSLFTQAILFYYTVFQWEYLKQIGLNEPFVFGWSFRQFSRVSDSTFDVLFLACISYETFQWSFVIRILYQYLKSVSHNTVRDFGTSFASLKKLLRLSTFFILLDWFGMVPFALANPAIMKLPFWLYTVMKLGNVSLFYHIMGLSYFYRILVQVTFPTRSEAVLSSATPLLDPASPIPYDAVDSSIHAFCVDSLHSTLQNTPPLITVGQLDSSPTEMDPVSDCSVERQVKVPEFKSLPVHVDPHDTSARFGIFSFGTS
jgi:hypothetical protein